MPPNKCLNWANQFTQLPNQSEFHELVREVFRTDKFFSGLKCYQEVPVIDIIPSYKNTLHRYDWYIQDIKTVLELHGEQHFKPVSFTNKKSFDAAQQNFLKIRTRDNAKMTAATDAGFEYKMLRYSAKKEITSEFLKEFLLGTL